MTIQVAQAWTMTGMGAVLWLAVAGLGILSWRFRDTDAVPVWILMAVIAFAIGFELLYHGVPGVLAG